MLDWWLTCLWLDLRDKFTYTEVYVNGGRLPEPVAYEGDTQPLPVIAGSNGPPEPVAPVVLGGAARPFIYGLGAQRFGFDLEGGHGGVVGKSGSGKGNIIQLLCLCVLELGKEVAELVVLDRKAGLDYAPFVGLAGFTLHRGRGTGRKDQILTGLKSIETEHQRRLELLFKAKKRNIKEYNKGRKDKLPYQVVVCDELADFTPTQKDYIETMVAMYRATGLVLVVATQHPLAKHLSSTIQGNLSWRFICRVANKRLNLVATGAATNDEIEIDPTTVVPGQAILRNEESWTLVNVPLLTEEWRDALIEKLPKEKPDDNGSAAGRAGEPAGPSA
jgi:hypothetical protein